LLYFSHRLPLIHDRTGILRFTTTAD
jgi:hypothetical protein